MDEEIKKVAEKLPFWQYLSQEDKENLLLNSTKITYKKGDIIHRGDEHCTGFIIVKSGQLRVYMLSEDGRENALYRLYENDVCTLSASCLFQEITFDVFIDVTRDCELILINNCVMGRVAEHNLYAQNYLYKVTVGHFSEVMWAMQQILFMSFDQRLAVFLLDESAKTKSLVIRLTHEQIARYMGSAREVVSRMLKYFSEEGIVRLSRGAVEITDKNQLRKLALG